MKLAFASLALLASAAALPGAVEARTLPLAAPTVAALPSPGPAVADTGDAAPMLVARRGSDDGAGDDHGGRGGHDADDDDDHGQGRGRGRGRGGDDAGTDDRGSPLLDLFRRGRGRDNAPGDDQGRRQGGHGADDAPGHTLLEQAPESLGLELARRGNGRDDAPGDDRGRRRGGRGADDGAGHAVLEQAPDPAPVDVARRSNRPVRGHRGHERHVGHA